MTDTGTQTKRETESLTGAIRQGYRAAYREGLKERKEVARFVYDQIADWRTRTNTTAVWLDYILRLSTTVTRSRKTTTDDRQYHFFDDLDRLYPIYRPEVVNQKTGKVEQEAHTDLVELGDFGLKEIEQRDEQVQANIEDAIKERNLWDRAKSYVVPLLKRNKKWKWRDAVEYLRERNALPDLERVE